MVLPSGISQIAAKIPNAIASVPVPNAVQRFFLWTSKPGPDIYPLEGSVIVGRSIASQKRGGLLELQERLPEELGVAFIWLKGVDVMRDLFDKRIKPKLFSGTEHLSGDIAWNWLGRKPSHVDLTPQELFTRNAAEVTQVLRMKSMRWVFSVGFALSMAAYVIPKLTQLKTNWILRHFYRNTPGQPPENKPAVGISSSAPYGRSTGQASPQALPLNNSVKPPGSESFRLGVTAPLLPALPQNGTGFIGDFSTQSPQKDFSQPVHPMPRQTAPASLRSSLPIQRRPGIFAEPNQPATQVGGGNVRFGSGLSLSSLVQGLGHSVDQTAYGSIVVVDSAIIGGRGAVASQRSAFEVLEGLVRDVGSLYFYILCAPHILKALSLPLNWALGGRVETQPQLTCDLTDAIKRQLADQKNISAVDLKRALLGASSPHLMDAEGVLTREMRSANASEFLTLLEKELNVYLPNASEAVATLQQAIKKQLAGEDTVGSKQIQHILEMLQSGDNALFATLRSNQKAGAVADTIVAVKQAFRHTVGLSFDVAKGHGLLLNGKNLQESEAFANVWKRLPSQTRANEWQALESRMRNAAINDGLNQANTMFRRSLNLVRTSPQGVSTDLGNVLKKADTVADWLDKAVNLNVSLEALMSEELASIGEAWQTLIPTENASLLERLSRKVQGLPLHLEELPTGISRLRTALSDPGKVTVAHVAQMKSMLSQMSQNKTAQALLERLEKIPFSLTAQESSGASSLWKKSAAEGLMTGIEDTMREFGGKASLSPAEKSLLEHYQSQLRPLLRGESGRLFSLSLSRRDAGLELKLRQMLQGGLSNEQAFLRKAQVALGEFTPDSRLYDAPDKLERLRKSVQDYGEALLKYVEKNAAAVEKEGWEAVLNCFYQLNRNTHFLARFAGMAGAMWGLAWLVPKIQYALTHRLTGKNINPGIASAETRVGVPGFAVGTSTLESTASAAPVRISAQPAQANAATPSSVNPLAETVPQSSLSVSQTAPEGLSTAPGLTRNNFPAFRRLV